MSECRALQQRPVRQDFSAIAGSVWLSNYCKRPRRDHCARLQLLHAGKCVPSDLLPHGTRNAAPSA